MSKNSQINLTKQKLEFLSLKTDFKKLVSEFRGKWNVPEAGIKTQAEASLWHKNNSKRSDINYKRDIKIILDKFRLSEYYQKPIEHYLLYNNFSNLDIANLKLYEEIDKDGIKKILIEIYPETTLEDIKGIWDIVKLMQKEQLDSKNKRRRNIVFMDTDKRIYELAQERKSRKEIIEIIQREFGGKRLSYDDVGKKLLRFRQKMRDT